MSHRRSPLARSPAACPRSALLRSLPACLPLHPAACRRPATSPPRRAPFSAFNSAGSSSSLESSPRPVDFGRSCNYVEASGTPAGRRAPGSGSTRDGYDSLISRLGMSLTCAKRAQTVLTYAEAGVPLFFKSWSVSLALPGPRPSSGICSRNKALYHFFGLRGRKYRRLLAGRMSHLLLVAHGGPGVRSVATSSRRGATSLSTSWAASGREAL